jgi:hypothetical protein
MDGEANGGIAPHVRTLHCPRSRSTWSSLVYHCSHSHHPTFRPSYHRDDEAITLCGMTHLGLPPPRFRGRSRTMGGTESRARSNTRNPRSRTTRERPSIRISRAWSGERSLKHVHTTTRGRAEDWAASASSTGDITTCDLRSFPNKRGRTQ